MIQTSEKKLFRGVAKQLFRIGKGKELELTVREQAGFLVRFANHEIHQNSSRDTLHFSIRMIEGGRSARVEISQPDPLSLQDALKRLVVLVRSREKQDGELPLIKQPSYRLVGDFDPAVEKENPARTARGLKEIFKNIRSQKAWASGYYSATLRSVYLANSRGLEAYHPSSSLRFGLTVRKGQGIGYASDFATCADRFSWDRVLSEAMDRAQKAERTVRIKPGRYKVIMAPRAFSEFASPLFEDLSGRKVADRDSYFWDKQKKRVFYEGLSVEDNVYHSRQTGLPFDGVGIPRRRISLVEKGVVKNFVYDQKAAYDLRVKPTGHTAGALQPSTMPINIVIQAGRHSWSEVLNSVDEALFIPHIWYHQVINPNRLLATGLIKGCALLWRKGEWVGGSSHVRYVESIPSALNRILAVSSDFATIKDREYGASVLPYLLIDGFRIV